METGEVFVRVRKALQSRARSLSLDCCKLTELPQSIVQLHCIASLSAKYNELENLPQGIGALGQLTYLNLGGNRLDTFPEALSDLVCLKKLHLFKNSIRTIPHSVLGSLSNLTLLNLNDNLITELPPLGLPSLSQLQLLSLSGNHIRSLPPQLSSLKSLTHLHLENNHLQTLPRQIGNLTKLQKLYLQKNKLQSLPQSIGLCRSLVVVDASCNEIDLFPREIQKLNLVEFYYECNPLVPCVPVPAEEHEEVLPLAELVARMLVRTTEDSVSVPVVQDLRSRAESCFVCKELFVNSWLECVEFVQTRIVFPHLASSGGGLIPLKASLCSHKCFRSGHKTHRLYGVAKLPNS